MKLRIKGDSLRLRVSRSELARLLNGERVEDTVHFSAGPGAYLTYAIQSARQTDPVRIDYVPQIAVVSISEERMSSWAKESEVGIYGSIDLGSSRSLEVIVEKDFACLDRSDEENTDTFSNPHSETVCR